jgi:DNA-binding transcriptional regulator LsrR (DeoR family)
MSRLKNSFARAGGINPEELQQLKEIVTGDLAGVVFKSEEHNLNSKQEEVFNKLVKRWTGIKFCHIKNCADRAYLHGKPGVIVVAYGEDKAQSVFQGIKNSLINRLFIDEELADGLVKLLENRETRMAI